jgi:hypothetical protein
VSNLPGNVSTSTVTGTIMTAEGIAAVGTVTFQPVPCRLVDASADVVLLGVPVVATLNAGGTFSVELVATDDPDLNPVDWVYAVTVRLSSPVAGWRFAMYAPAGETVDIADAVPVEDPATGTAIVVGPAGPAGEGMPPGGVAGEVLAKLSDDDYDLIWTPASAPGLHASTHAAGSTDPVTITQAQVTGLPAALAAKAGTTVFTSGADGLTPASGGGTANYLRADGTWTAPPGGGGGGISGVVIQEADATVATAATTIDFGAGFDVTETPANEANIALDLTEYTGGALPIAGGGTGATAAFAGTTPGVVPTSAGGTANFLRADGTWAQPGSGFDGTGGHASWVFNATTTAAPAATQIRMNNANNLLATTLWVHQNDFDNLDVTVGLAKILAGHQIYIQDYDDASKWVKYNVTAAVDSGAYFTFTIAYHSGPGGLPTGSGAAGRIELQGIAPGSVGVPPGGTTAQALTKTTSADYAVGWSNVVANVSGAAGLWAGTQASYDALGSWSATTLYVIT